MTHFVAAWAPPNTSLDPAIASRLQAALARTGAIGCAASPRCTIVHWESRLWPGESAQSEGTRSVVVAGDPVVVLGTQTLSRGDAVKHLCRHAFENPSAVLNTAEGTYAGIIWDSSGAMLVCTDKLGVRPVYWAEAGGVVYVSTVKWALASIAAIPAAPDLRGVVEACAFGAPLADRTLTSAVRALGAGEFIDLTGHAPVVRHYKDWRAVEESRVSVADLPQYITEAFNQAMDARLCGQERVFAFLSGGMDSRLVVSRLRARGADVCALNFAPPGSQDLLFGRMAAEAMGARFFEFDDDGADFLVRRDKAFKAWHAAPANAGPKPAQDRLVWSGDGGSVGLGHVYLTQAIVAAARAGDLVEAARAIQRTNRYDVSPNSFSKRYRDLALLPLDGIVEDLRSREGMEPGRNAFLFFMLNDQRRHLAVHYESLHEDRIDLVVPFFDGRFLQAVCSSPIDPFLLHRLYNRVMAQQPFGLGQVPWQVYPGHEPCPVAVADPGRLQWQEGWFDSGIEKRNLRRRMRRSLRFALSKEFPAEILNRPVLLGAALAGAFGSGKYGYLLKPIAPLCEAVRITAV